jgi:hypothetical protein
MKASVQQRQLNIRSNDAYERAHKLAAQRSTSITAVIEQALRDYEVRGEAPSGLLPPDDAVEKAQRLREALRKLWDSGGPPDGLSSDHSWLYDENGLPK